jgi:hypothetical protein
LVLKISGFEQRALDKVLGFPFTKWCITGYRGLYIAEVFNRVTVLFRLDPQDWLLPEAVFIEKLRAWRREYVSSQVGREDPQA